MKLNLSQLKQIIKEEVDSALNEVEKDSDEELLRTAEEHLKAASRALNGILGKDLDKRDPDVEDATNNIDAALASVRTAGTAFGMMDVMDARPSKLSKQMSVYLPSGGNWDAEKFHAWVNDQRRDYVAAARGDLLGLPEQLHHWTEEDYEKLVKEVDEAWVKLLEDNIENGMKVSVQLQRDAREFAEDLDSSGKVGNALATRVKKLV